DRRQAFVVGEVPHRGVAEARVAADLPILDQPAVLRLDADPPSALHLRDVPVLIPQPRLDEPSAQERCSPFVMLTSGYAGQLAQPAVQLLCQFVAAQHVDSPLVGATCRPSTISRSIRRACAAASSVTRPPSRSSIHSPSLRRVSRTA